MLVAPYLRWQISARSRYFKSSFVLVTGRSRARPMPITVRRFRRGTPRDCRQRSYFLPHLQPCPFPLAARFSHNLAPIMGRSKTLLPTRKLCSRCLLKRQNHDFVLHGSPPYLAATQLSTGVGDRGWTSSSGIVDFATAPSNGCVQKSRPCKFRLNSCYFSSRPRSAITLMGGGSVGSADGTNTECFFM